MNSQFYLLQKRESCKKYGEFSYDHVRNSPFFAIENMHKIIKLKKFSPR